MTSIFIAKQMQQKALITATNWECSDEPCFFVGSIHPRTVRLIPSVPTLTPTYPHDAGAFWKISKSTREVTQVFFFMGLITSRIFSFFFLSLLNSLRKPIGKSLTNGCTKIFTLSSSKRALSLRNNTPQSVKHDAVVCKRTGRLPPISQLGVSSTSPVT